MPRASGPQHAERLNLAFGWLNLGVAPVEAAERLAAKAGISRRQAYRYIEQAQQLDARVPTVEAKVVFSVKLPQALVDRIHRFAASRGETLSEIVSRALWAMIRPRGGRG